MWGENMKNKYNNFSNDIMSQTSELSQCVDKGAYSDNEKVAIREYCHGAVDSITYTDDEKKVYEYYMSLIMQNLQFDGQVMPIDVTTIVKYLARKEIKEANYNAQFEIVPDYIYMVKYGKSKIKTCPDKNDGSTCIHMRKSLINSVLQDGAIDQCKMLYLLESIYHEMSMIYQDNLINQQCHGDIQSKAVLFWLKEKIISRYDSCYCQKNYKNLYAERDANIQSKYRALDAASKYFRYFGLRFISDKRKDALDYLYDKEHLKHLDPATNYKVESDAEYVVDDYIKCIAKNYPQAVVNYLSIQYNDDGTMRSSKELDAEYWTKKRNLQTQYATDTTIYQYKLKQLQELYDYLIWKAKEEELLKTKVNNNQKTKVYKK